MKDEIYSIIAVTAGGERGPGRYEFKTLFTTRNDAEFEDLQKLLRERHFGFRRESFARNTRSVVVVGVDSKEHAQAQAVPGRNKLVSKPVKRGQRFRSAAAASGHLGLKNNEVAIYLSRAYQSGSKTTTLRGVTLAYADE